MAPRSSGPITVSITPSSIFWTLAIVVGAWLVYYLRDLVLIVLTAIVIASSIEPAVLWFMRHKIIRPAAVALVYVIIFGLLFLFAYFLVPPLIEDSGNFLATLPEVIDTFDIGSAIPSELVPATQTVAQANPTTLLETLREFQNVFTSTSEGAFRAIAGIFGGVFSFFLVLVLSFYFAMQETGIDDFIRIISPVKHQKYAISLWRRAQVKIGLWMQGQLVLSLIVAVLTYLLLAIFQVPYPLLLAIFAAVAELVPVFGSLAAAIPAVIVAFSVGGVPLLLTIGIGYLIINQIQGNLIYPLVVKRVVGVPPILVIIALIIGAQLAGFLGVLLSVPVAAAIQEFISDVQKSKAEQAKSNA